jgi:hypothetical protein
MEVDRRKEVQEAARKAARATAIKAATGYFILVIVLLVGAFIYQRHTDAVIKSGLSGACKRVNTLRVKEANRNAQVIWAAFYYSWERERKLATMGQDEQTHAKSALYIRKSMDSMTWVPVTDCAAAVADPDDYDPPRPQRFDPSYLDFGKVPK